MTTARARAKTVCPKKVRNVNVWFFSDGFSVDDNPENQEKGRGKGKEADAAPKPPAPRKTGLASLNDYKSTEPGIKGMDMIAQMPKLPPLRSYEGPGNEDFLRDLKMNIVPKELRKKDETTGEPIGVSISVSDFRPRPYPQEVADMQNKLVEQLQKRGAEADSGGSAGTGSALFGGAGHSLSSSSGSGSAAAGGATAGSNGGAAGGGSAGVASADPAILRLVKGVPPPEADESNPATTMNIRMSSGARIKVRLNLDHTVADVWRHVASQMGADAFAAASGHELVAGFPPKGLTDTSATIKDADLAGAAITHRCR